MLMITKGATSEYFHTYTEWSQRKKEVLKSDFVVVVLCILKVCRYSVSSTTVRLTLNSLTVLKCLTVESIHWKFRKLIKCSLLHYFKKVIEMLHYILSKVICNL